MDKNVQAGINEAQVLVRSGEPKAALELLLALRSSVQSNLELDLNLAMIYRQLGKLSEAVAALDRVLAQDPYSFLALLSKGSIFEQLGSVRRAGEIYKNALKIAPPANRLPSSLLGPIEQAQSLVQAQNTLLYQDLKSHIDGFLEMEPSDEVRSRIQGSLELLTGRSRLFHSQAIQLQYPGLPAVPFFDRSHFPWLSQLEAESGSIKQELTTFLENQRGGFSPYVAYAPGTPENQFAELNHSNRWQSLWLWKDGEPKTDEQAYFPITTEILKGLPLCDQPGFAPTALFSALAPKTRIPPHTGSTNVRALVHLPLILPGPAHFRVGNKRRSWRFGEAWVFDDTIEHEAQNDADETRFILIFDVWNPFISEIEKRAITQLLLKHRSWLSSE